MADPNHLAVLRQGVEAWNKWIGDIEESQPDTADDEPSDKYEFRPNLSYADLRNLDLRGINFENCFLFHANLSYSNLEGANLENANMAEAIVEHANLRKVELVDGFLNNANFNYCDLSDSRLLYIKCWDATFRSANFSGANLFQADFYVTDLQGAILNNCFLEGARLIECNLEDATLNGCHIHGISAWDLKLTNAEQSDLIVTPENTPAITVDNIEVAQFIYLLIHNEKIRHIIDSITTKVVLILGRFTNDRKPILDAIRDELREQDYLPVLFDFDKPHNRDITETVSTLAHMSRFVIADISEAKSIPQELQQIVPDMPSVPIVPILHVNDKEYGMFEHFTRYPWVLKTYNYKSAEELINSIAVSIIAPAEAKASELRR